MYCPNCNKEYNGKFCPECGTKLVDRPADGISLSLGDANAISGGVHLSDSHNVHNVDRSIHNITNVDTTVNNITQVAAQKTEMEIIQERKLLFLNACRRACEDMTIDQDDVNHLDEYRLEIGLDEKTANEILQQVKDNAVKSIVKTELDTLSKVLLKQFNANLKQNRVGALNKQLEFVEAMANKYANEEVQYKFYLALATLRAEQCIKRYEDLQGENYWQSFWSYFAYLKEGKLQEAEALLIDMDKFTGYPADNTVVLGGAGAAVKGNDEEARDYIGEISGDYTPMLQRFVESLYLVLGTTTASEMGDEASNCTYYLQHLYAKEPQTNSAHQNKKAEMPIVSYYVAVNGQPYGPCSMAQLLQLKEQTTLTPDTYVWNEGMENWEFAKNREDLISLFAANITEKKVIKEPTKTESTKSVDNADSMALNMFSGIEVPAEMLDSIIVNGSSTFKAEAMKMWGLSRMEAWALSDICEDYYKKNGHWPDGHKTEFKSIPIEDIPNDMLDLLIKEGFGDFREAAKKKWNMSFNEAFELAQLCHAYYAKHGCWPDGHKTEKPSIKVSIEEVPNEILDLLVKEGRSSFIDTVHKALKLTIKESIDLHGICEDYYEKNGHWPDGHKTELKIIPIEDVPNDMLDLLEKGEYREFDTSAKNKWSLSPKEVENLKDSCHAYYRRHGQWPDGHKTALKTISIEDVPNDMLDLLVKEGISEFMFAASKKWNLTVSEAYNLLETCDDYYTKNGHWPDGHVTDFKIKK